MDFLHFRVWEGAGLCTHILEGHSDGVTSVSVINPEGIKTISSSCCKICLVFWLAVVIFY